jgi:enterochelin esterase-like enzyme
VVAVFVPRVEPAEYGGEKADDYTRFLIEEVLPHIDRHYRTDGETRAIMGPGSAGVAALYASFQNPDVFQQAAAQSYYTIAPTDEKLPEMIAATGDKPSHIYMVWSNHDYDLGPGLRAAEASQDLLVHLRDADVNVVEQVANYSPQWGGWRGQHDEILAALFPAEESEE